MLDGIGLKILWDGGNAEYVLRVEWKRAAKEGTKHGAGETNVRN